MTDTQKAAQVQKMQMMNALEKVKAETVVYEEKGRKQTELMDKNKKEIMSCKKKMTDLVGDLIRDLREHDRIMRTKFGEIYEAQQKRHATQLENFELVLTQLKSWGVCKWRNLPEPTGTPRNLPGTYPEPTRNLEKSANDKIKKQQITKNNTNQIKIMKMK